MLVSSAAFLACTARQLDLIDDFGGTGEESETESPIENVSSEVSTIPTSKDESRGAGPDSTTTVEVGVVTVPERDAFARDADVPTDPFYPIPCPPEAPLRTDTGSCVQCFHDWDCAPGFGCNEGFLICQRKCSSTKECFDYDRGERPICDLSFGLCRYCFEGTYECGAGFACRQGQCWPAPVPPSPPPSPSPPPASPSSPTGTPTTTFDSVESSSSLSR